MRAILLAMTVLVACQDAAPWGTESACQAAADAVCSRRVECGARGTYDLCYDRVIRDCRLGLDGLHEVSVVEQCLDATQGICIDHVPSECTDWWCTGADGQDYCP